MSVVLRWMRPHAPYMPIATAGLLSLLERQGHHATAHWEVDDVAWPALRIETTLDEDDIAELVASSRWPDETLINWPINGGRGSAQALKPLLKETGRPLECFRRMVDEAPPLEAALLRAILTDGAVDGDGVPVRNRLLRGVKSDLTSAFKRPRRIVAEDLAKELREGLAFQTDAKGLGLGLVPEVQTFGGSTGPDPASIDAYSPLLYLLLWSGIMALPPVPVLRGWTRMVGGPLVTDVDVLSWPRWRVPVGLSGLRTLFCLGELHAAAPDLSGLRARGIDRVYRARAVELNSMIAVYRWGAEVAA